MATSPDELMRLRDAVTAIATAASAQILEVYASAPTKVDKADGSPLTEADLRAHRVIVDGLRALTPSLPILSEEAADVPWETRARWERFWLVDPLDGTKEFLARNGEFTVNIALVEEHAPVLGVVQRPVTGTSYAGVVGRGAWRAEGDGAFAEIRVRIPAPSTVRVVGSRSHADASLNTFLARLGAHELVPMGSSLKLCLVAEGAADLYPRLGPTSAWDTAAAHAVVLAAGGAVVDAAGRPLRYNVGPEILNPHFFVYGDSSRDWLGAT